MKARCLLTAGLLHAPEMRSPTAAHTIEHMSELPPDLQRLRVLETYLRLQFDTVRAAIARAEREQRQARPQRAARPPHPEQAGGDRTERSLPPDDLKWWRVRPRQGGDPPKLHRGDCPGTADLPTLTRHEAVLLLRDYPVSGTVSCSQCRPDLGLAEG